MLNSGCYTYGLPIRGGGNTQYTPYLFGNKEFEDRQGLNTYDFGARTYVPDECRFWQPDPKAHDYHWLSPYAYCGGDPINFIDPTGMVRYYVGMDGRIISREEAALRGDLGVYAEDLEEDQIVVVGDNGGVVWASSCYEQGTIISSNAIPILTDDLAVGQMTILKIKGDNAALEIFEGISNAITEKNQIEVGINLYGAYSYGSINDVFTSHSQRAIYGTELMLSSRVLRKTLRDHIHSHPTESYPSEPDYNNMLNVVNYARNHQLRVPKFSIYNASKRKYRVYDQNSPYIGFDHRIKNRKK